MSKVALVLPGGGYRGAKQVGFAKELFVRKQPSIIQGVSVGALNAAGLVEIGPDGIEARWREIERKGPSSIFNWIKALTRFFFSSYFFPDKGLAELVNQIGIEKIINSPIELQVVVRNENTKEKVVFSSRDDRIINNPEILRKAIRASASLPGFFPAVEIEGEWYSDGYYFDLEELVDNDTICVVFNDDPAAINKDLHAAHCFKRMFVGYGEVLDDMIEEKIDNFLEHHSEFNEFKVDSNLNPILRSAKKFIDRGKKLVGLGKQLIAISPSYSISTLELDTFKPPNKSQEGDISKAIRLSQEQAKRLLDQITL